MSHSYIFCGNHLLSYFLSFFLSYSFFFFKFPLSFSFLYFLFLFSYILVKIKTFVDCLVRDHLVSSQSMILCHIPIFPVVTTIWMISFPLFFSFLLLFFFLFSFLLSIVVMIWKLYGLCGQRPFSIKSEYNLDSPSYICGGNGLLSYFFSLLSCIFCIFFFLSFHFFSFLHIILMLIILIHFFVLFCFQIFYL